MQTRDFRNISLLLLIFQVSTMAALRSGTGNFPFPPYYPDTATCMDFSLMNDSCSNKLHLCPCPAIDLWIKGDSIRSTYGIQADSALGALAVKRAMPISNPSLVGPAIDSLFDSLCVVAPVGGWTKSAHLQLGAFYVKTSESSYALLVIFYQYIGGVDRYYFYWAYQDNGMRWLYKAIGPLSTSDSIVVIPFCFSGRPDPVFVLKDSADVAIVHRAIDSVTSLASSIGTAFTSYPSHGGF